jgi:hypothetical protein
MMTVMVLIEDLSDPERRVWDAFPRGETVNFQTGNAEQDDLTNCDMWGPDRQIRAEVIGALLCGALATEPGRVGQVSLRGARITGMVDLKGGELKSALWLYGCVVADGIDVADAAARTLALIGCRLGPIAMAGSTIAGQLILAGTELYRMGHHPALHADGLTVTGSVMCNDRFRAVGQVRLPGVSVKGVIDLSGAHLDGKGGTALHADGLIAGGDVFCRDGFRADGPVRFQDASVKGVLDLSGARLDGKGSPALLADGLAATGGVFCRSGFRADGEVRLVGASISSELDLSGAQLHGSDGRALSADRLSVTTNVYCGRGFRTRGEASLVGASISGSFVLTGAHLDGEDGLALSADGLTVARGMFCDDFRARGGVRLIRASITGQLVLTDARMDGKNGPALNADGLTVTGDMLCARLRAQGEVDLRGASVTGQLILSAAQLDGQDCSALRADGLAVHGSMLCGDGFRATGPVSLTRASIGVLNDDVGSWPRELEMSGLIYGDLDPYLSAHKRLAWLARCPHYAAQPYEQLAAYYRGLGHDEQARRVLLAKRRARRRLRRWWAPARWWEWLQDALAGYGYAPGRALALLALAFCAGWLLFRANQPPPVNPKIHPSFNAALYTVDLLLPAPGLGATNDWDPHGGFLIAAVGLRAIGWLLAITVIAAITRMLNRS